MEQNVLPDSQLNNDIATVRSQIKSLRHRRSLLANALLSNRRLQNRLRHAKSTATSSTLPGITDVLSQAESQMNANTTNLYRTCSSITAFRVKDPDPHAINSGDVLGVRIDVFSTSERRFMTPYYLLLHQPIPGETALKVHKHTIPSYVPLQQLTARYLPLPEFTSQSSKGSSAQNLPALVRALRRELVARQKRLAALENLNDALGSKKSWKALDPSGTEFEQEWSSGSIARIKVGVTGKIERAVVRASTDQAGDGAGKRRKIVEGDILGGNGSIEGLADRLKKH